MTRLYTFKDLLALVPLKERALRGRLGELGYSTGGRKLLLTEAQVRHIQAALSANRGAVDHEPETATPRARYGVDDPDPFARLRQLAHGMPAPTVQGRGAHRK